MEPIAYGLSGKTDENAGGESVRRSSKRDKEGKEGVFHAHAVARSICCYEANVILCYYRKILGSL